jgi:hypothetical protein
VATRKKAKDQHPFWIRTELSEVAAALGNSIQTLERYWIKSGMPGGESGPWDIVEIAKWHYSRKGGRSGVDQDPMLDGPASPALEQYREARAALARLELENRQKSLIPRVDVHQALARIAAIIRQAGDSLQRLFGTEAHAILEEALDDAEREIESSFGDSASEE